MFLEKIIILLFVIFNNELLVKSNDAPQTGNGDFALSFVGRLEQFSISDKLTNFPTEEFTLMLWANLNPGDEGNSLINIGSMKSDGEIAFVQTDPLKSVVLGHYLPWENLPFNSWNLITLRWSSKTGIQEIFFNNELVASNYSDITQGKSLSSELWILLGQDSDTAPPIPPWDQSTKSNYLIDELMVWNRLVEVEEIDQLLRTSFTLTSQLRKGLISWWPFSEGTGYFAKDIISGWTLYLGGGENQLVSFDSKATPSWLVSTAPIFKNKFISSFIPDQNTLITIPVYDREQDKVSVELKELPIEGAKVFEYKGEGKSVGKEITQVPFLLKEGKFWFWFDSSSTSLELNELNIEMEYSVEDDKGNQVQSQMILHVNRPPIVFSKSISTYEDMMTVLQFSVFDPEGEPLTITIPQLPSNGTLFHYEDQIPFQSGDQVGDLPDRRIWYVSSPDESGDSLSTVEFVVSDEIYSVSGTFTINVKPVSDPPTAPQIILEIEEDHSGIIDFTQVSDRDKTDFILIKHLTQLPKFGKVFQYDENFGKGAQIASVVGPPIENPTQYVSQVSNFSSEYNWQGDWAAKGLIGKPDCFEEYCDASPHSDCKQAWCAKTISGGIDGTGLEFLEVKYENPVFLKNVEIFENLNPGSVFKVEALFAPLSNNLEAVTTEISYETSLSEQNIRTTITTVTTTTSLNMTLFEQVQEQEIQQRQIVWEGEPQLDILPVARIFRPQVCNTDSKVEGLRVYLNSTAINGWIEVDAISMIGSLEPNPRGMVTRGKYLLYEPQSDWNGEINFNYQVYDCSGQQVESLIKIIITPVNDGPRPIIQNHRVILGEMNELSLESIDVENDTMNWFLVEIPSIGELYDGLTGKKLIQDQQKNEIKLSSNVLNYWTENTNQLKVSFKWRVEDIHGDSSQIVEEIIGVDCRPGYVRVNSSTSHGDICEECPSNTFSEDINSRKCFGCSEGYKSNSGSMDCVKDVLEVSNTSLIVAQVLSIISLIYVGMLMVILFFFRDLGPIRASNFWFCMLILVGGMVICISVLLSSLDDENNIHCSLPPWFLTIGMSISLSAIIVKNFHVYRLFNTSNVLRSKKVSNRTLFLFVLLGCLPNILIMTSWQKLEGGVEEKIEEYDKNYIKMCSSEGEEEYLASLYVYNGLLVVMCLLIAIVSRNIYTEFNESKVLGFCIYNMTLFVILVVVVSMTLITQPSPRYLISEVGILFAVISTFTIFFGYKFYRCMLKPETTKGMSTVQPTE